MLSNEFEPCDYFRHVLRDAVNFFDLPLNATNFCQIPFDTDLKMQSSCVHASLKNLNYKVTLIWVKQKEEPTLLYLYH